MEIKFLRGSLEVPPVQSCFVGLVPNQRRCLPEFIIPLHFAVHHELDWDLKHIVKESKNNLDKCLFMLL